MASTDRQNRQRQDNLDKIKKALIDKRLTVVFGTGISINAIKGSTATVSEKEKNSAADGLKWNGLILNGLRDLESEHKEDLEESEKRELACYRECLEKEKIAVGTTIRAATFLKAKLKDLRTLQYWLNFEFKNLYDKYIGDGENDILDSIKRLHKAGARIITTNYDDLISRHCGTPAIVPKDAAKLKDFFANEDVRKSILHIHGLWSEAEDAVLDEIDYFKTSTHSFLQDGLKGCLIGPEVVLFVGTNQGLEDPNFGNLLRWADKELEFRANRHYVLVSEGERKPRGILRMINYGKYDQLPSFLSELAPNAEDVRTGGSAEIEPQGHFRVERMKNIPEPSGNFTGRKSDLEKLHTAITATDSTTKENPVIVIYGTGGVGKTQLVSKYVREHTLDFNSIFWVAAQSSQDVEDSFFKIARHLMEHYIRISRGTPHPLRIAKQIGLVGLVDPHGEIAAGREAACRIPDAVKLWFERKENGGWLLVFDNVDDLETFRITDYFPHPSSGSILVTSRRPAIAQLGFPIELEEMDEESSIKLLWKASGKRFSMKSDHQEAWDIVKKLGYLPLAIDQAGAYLLMSQWSGKRITKYLEDFEEQTKFVLGLKPPTALWQYRDETVFTTWEVSFRALKAITPPLAADILLVCSFLSNRDISEDFLAQGLEATRDSRVRESLFAISSYSLISRDKTAEGYNIHPLVHRWARERLSSLERYEFALQAFNLVIAAMKMPDEVKDEDWQFQRRNLHHAETVATWAERILLTSETWLDKEHAKETREFGLLWHRHGHYERAQHWLTRALKGFEDSVGPESPETLTVVHDLAELYWDMGQVMTAKRLNTQALEGRTKIYGSNHWETLQSMHNVATLLHNKGDCTGAKELYKKVREACKDSSGRQSRNTFIEATGNLASVLSDERNYEEAMTLYQQLLNELEGTSELARLEVMEKIGNLELKREDFEAAVKTWRTVLKGYKLILGPDHPFTLRVLDKLAQALTGMEDYMEAENASRQAIEGTQKTLGRADISTLAARTYTLANVMMQQKDYNKAETICKELMKEAEAELGLEHPETLQSINSLGWVLSKQGKHSEAEEHYREAAEGRKHTLGPEHPDTLLSVSNLGVELHNQRKYSEAEEKYREVAEGRKHTLGPKHSDTLQSINSLGEVLSEQGKYSEAEEKYREAVEGRKHTLGLEHPDTLWSINDLGVALRNQGKYSEAEEKYREVTEGRKHTLGPKHSDTLESINCLGVVLSKQGKHSEGEEKYREAAEGRKHTLGLEHPDTLLSINNLGVALQYQGKYSEAEEKYREVAEGRKHTLGPKHSDTLQSINSLGLVLSDQGKYSEAEEKYREAAEGRKHTLGLEHPDTLLSIYNLGVALHNQGKYSEAEENYREVIEGRKHTLGPKHSDTLQSINSLGLVLSDQGKHSEAEELILMVERILREEHPTTLAARQDLAGLLVNHGRYEEGEQEFNQVIPMAERILGNENPTTLMAKQNLAAVKMCQGRYEEAERAFNQIIPTAERILGKEDPTTLMAKQNLAAVMMNLGRYEEAEQEFNKVIPTAERILGNEHPTTLMAKQNLAAVKMYQGRYEEAERAFNQVIPTAEKILGKEDPTTLMAKQNLAAVMMNLGRYEEGEQEFNQVIPMAERILGNENPTTLVARQNLARVLMNQGRYEEAEQEFNKVIPTAERILGKEHPTTLAARQDLAEVLMNQRKYEEAGQKSRLAVEVNEQRNLVEKLPDTTLAMESLQNYPRVHDYLAPLLDDDAARNGIAEKLNDLKSDLRYREDTSLGFLNALGSLNATDEDKRHGIGQESTHEASQAITQLKAHKYHRQEQQESSTHSHGVDLVKDLQCYPQLQEYLAPLLKDDAARKVIEEKLNELKSNVQYIQESALSFLNGLGSLKVADEEGQGYQENVRVSESTAFDPGDDSGNDSDVGEDDGLGEDAGAGGDDNEDGFPGSRQPQPQLPPSDERFMDWRQFREIPLSSRPDAVTGRRLTLLAVFETLKVNVSVLGNSVNMEGFLSVIYTLLRSEDLLAYFRSTKDRMILLPEELPENVDLDDFDNALFDTTKLSGFDRHLTAITYGSGEYGSITLFELDMLPNQLPCKIRPQAVMKHVPKFVLEKYSYGIKGCSRAKLCMPRNQIWAAIEQSMKAGKKRQVLRPAVQSNEGGIDIGMVLKEALSMNPATHVDSFRATVPLMIAMLHHKAAFLKDIKSSQVQADQRGWRGVEMVGAPAQIGHEGKNPLIVVLSTSEADWVGEMLSWK